MVTTEKGILDELREVYNLLLGKHKMLAFLLPKVEYIEQQINLAKKHGTRLWEFTKALKRLPQQQKYLVGIDKNVEDNILLITNYIPGRLDKINGRFQYVVNLYYEGKPLEALSHLVIVQHNVSVIINAIKHLFQIEKRLKPLLGIELKIEAEEHVVLQELNSIQGSFHSISYDFSQYLNDTIDKIARAEREQAHNMVELARRIWNNLPPQYRADPNTQKFFNAVMEIHSKLGAIIKNLTLITTSIRQDNLKKLSEEIQKLPEIEQELDYVIRLIERLLAFQTYL